MHVAVVGAGPAGAWAARALASAGIRVTLFDDSHPREKPCGGGLTGRAVRMVTRELGAFPVPAVRIRTARFERAMRTPGDPASGPADYADVLMADSHASSSEALLIVSRARFDAALLESAVHAGAAHVAARVHDLVIDARGAHITTRHGNWHADVVLGADGANSVVRRRVASPLSRAQISVGAGCYVHGVSSDQVVVRWVANPSGYLWSFPRPDHLAVGSCAQAPDLHGAARLKQDSFAWIGAAGLVASPQRDAVRTEPYAWPIPALDATSLREALPLAGERWMLLGDAAGLVDPLTREGIFYALQSGLLAAAALTPGVQGAAARYRASVHQTMVPELVRAAHLKARFFTPVFSQLVVTALARSRAIRAVMADLMAGEQSYVGLERRLLATGRFDLAMSMLMARRRTRVGPDTA